VQQTAPVAEILQSGYRVIRSSGQRRGRALVNSRINRFRLRLDRAHQARAPQHNTGPSAVSALPPYPACHLKKPGHFNSKGFLVTAARSRSGCKKLENLASGCYVVTTTPLQKSVTFSSQGPLVTPPVPKTSGARSGCSKRGRTPRTPRKKLIHKEITCRGVLYCRDEGRGISGAAELAIFRGFRASCCCARS
jgi:hypothetical protein